MRRIIPISLLLLALVAPAGAAAQGNSGLGAYQEGPPSAGGNNNTSGTTATTTTTPTTTTPTSSSGTVTESAGTQSSAASTRGTSSGELPVTGSDTTLLALIGVTLFGAGLAMRRMMRPSGAVQGELGLQDYRA